MHGDPSPTPPNVPPAIFIASLTDYVNGIIHGRWVPARASPIDLQSELDAVLASSPWTRQTGEPAEEWIILDHEGFGSLCPDPHEALADLAALAPVDARGPARMAPMVFGGSIAGHLVGASVGREGAALQMAGSVTDTAARAARLTPDERRILIAASLAGGWGAVFGVPFAGIAFTLQVTRRHRWRALPPAIVSAFAGKLVVDSLGYRMSNRPQIDAPDWTFSLPIKLLFAGLAFGLAARLFVWLLQIIAATARVAAGGPGLYIARH